MTLREAPNRTCYLVAPPIGLLVSSSPVFRSQDYFGPNTKCRSKIRFITVLAMFVSPFFTPAFSGTEETLRIDWHQA
jgi:hypothetical protein